MTREVFTVDDALFQTLLQSLCLAKLKTLGYNGDQIERISQEDRDRLISDLDDAVTTIVSDTMSRLIDDEPPMDEAWMMVIANLAVQDNLREDGTPVYQNAQGYACALSALKTVFEGSGPEARRRVLEVISALQDEEAEPEQTSDENPIDIGAIRQGTKDMFYGVMTKYGPDIASGLAVSFYAEKHGIFDLNSEEVAKETVDKIYETVRSFIPELTYRVSQNGQFNIGCN